MARKRIAGTQFSSWDEVDGALRDIAEIDRQLGMLQAAHDEAVDKLKETAKEEAEPLQHRRASLEAAMKDYCQANRQEFLTSKTKVLAFGNVGFRLSTKVVVKNVGDTLQLLKSLGLHGCVRIKEELDKEAMRNLNQETLANVGAALKTENAFGYEVKRDELVEA